MEQSERKMKELIVEQSQMINDMFHTLTSSMNGISNQVKIIKNEC